jgi:catechol 2,3-dioxygenase-like lactoylglutathione lyase family enzyme
MTIARIVPQFFTSNLEKTLSYYDASLGFVTQFVYGDPVYYAGAIRDGYSIFFRHVDQPTDLSDEKYREEYLDAYIRVEGVDNLYEEYAEKQIDFHRRIATMPWGYREFVVRDCDGRLLCFGEEHNSG